MTVDSADTRATATAAAEPRQLAPAADRGRTTMSDTVVSKVAARSAGEVAHASGTRRRLVGRSIGRANVGVRAEVVGRRAALRLELAVDYGVPARSVTRLVRAHVTESVQRMCDLDVEHLEIVVTALQRADSGEGR